MGSVLMMSRAGSRVDIDMIKEEFSHAEPVIKLG
jgi:hypothetical protein